MGNLDTAKGAFVFEIGWVGENAAFGCSDEPHPDKNPIERKPAKMEYFMKFTELPQNGCCSLAKVILT